jgi:tRNA1(Val) A37 N6-methylase TrmN6
VTRHAPGVRGGAHDATAALTEDRLLGGRVVLVQPREGYRAAIDPVLLAAFVPARAGEHVLDAGGGTGAASFCLLARVPDCRVTALEIDTELAALAREGAALNRLTDRLRVVEGDIQAAPAPLAAGGFDHVMMNPPFHERRRAQASRVRTRARAHVEEDGGLEAWIEFAHRMLRPRGTLSLVHRADRLDQILSALSAASLGGAVVFPLWPMVGKPAKRVLLRAQKGSRAGVALLPGLVLHDASGRFTPEADAVLREATAIEA